MQPLQELMPFSSVVYVLDAVLEIVKIWGTHRTNHHSIAFMQSGLTATRLADNSP
jgi:hypothetical protein